MFEKIWNWLNGNKTVFGLFLLQVATWVPEDTVLFGFIPVREALQWIGGVLSGAGVVHKIAKASTTEQNT